MIKLFLNLKKLIQWQYVKTSGFIFRAHSSFTTAVLLAFSLVITAKEYVGSPIECITQHRPESFINTYCWIQSTYTMPNAYLKQIGTHVPHHGIANDNGEDGKYHKYYQWVCFVLFGQAVLCYLPKWIWENTEGGLIRSLIVKEDNEPKKVKVITRYLIKHMNLHGTYAMTYWFCELLCLINIFSQMYFMNWFLNGEFLSYGSRVLFLSLQNQNERVDPMIYVFPRITKCVFKKFGPSGNIQNFDNLCILPLNIINEKTYIFIWFWFFILLCLLSALILTRILLFSCVNLRTMFLFSWSKVLPRKDCKLITKNLSLSDWWILCLVRDNVDQITFKDIVNEISSFVNKSPRVKENLYTSSPRVEVKEEHFYPSVPFGTELHV